MNFKKIVIFSESLDPQNHYGTNRSWIHSVFAKLEIAPRKRLYHFLLHSNLCDSLVNFSVA